MAISYEPFEVLLFRRKMRRDQLRQEGILSAATLAKFRKNEYVSLEVIDRLCTYFNCEIVDIVMHVKEKPRTEG